MPRRFGRALGLGDRGKQRCAGQSIEHAGFAHVPFDGEGRAAAFGDDHRDLRIANEARAQAVDQLVAELGGAAPGGGHLVGQGNLDVAARIDDIGIGSQLGLTQHPDRQVIAGAQFVLVGPGFGIGEQRIGLRARGQRIGPAAATAKRKAERCGGNKAALPELDHYSTTPGSGAPRGVMSNPAQAAPRHARDMERNG